MVRIKCYTVYLKKRFLIDASKKEEKKIRDFIEAHKLPRSFYLNLRLREMDKRLIQKRNLEETLNMMTEKRNLIVEWNSAMQLKAIVKTLKFFTKSSGAICYIVEPINKEYLFVVFHHEGRIIQRNAGDVFKISDKLCLATSAAANKKVMMASYLSKDCRFPLGNGWPKSDDEKVLAVPIMKSNSDVLGVIELTKPMFTHEYSSIDIEGVSLLTSLFGYLAEESEITTEIHMLLTFINPMMKLITQYLECTLPVVGIISQLTATYRYFYKTLNNLQPDYHLQFMNKNELQAINCSFCVKKIIRAQQYNIIYTEDLNNPHCHVQTSKILSRNDQSLLGNSMSTAKKITKKEKNSQQWLLVMPIMFNEVTGAIQFQFLCSCEPNISEQNVKLLEITCTFLGFILEMNELDDELFKREKEIIVIEEMLKLQTGHCQHELLTLQDAPGSNEVANDIYSYSWSPSILNEEETNLILFRNIVGAFVGHLFVSEKSLNEFILFVKRTYIHFKEISYRHVFVTTHFIATFLKNNGDYFSVVEKDALVMSALCHCIHKCEQTYSFIYVSIFKTFGICENSTEQVSNGIIKKMKRWKYFYPCNLSDQIGFKKKYRELINLIGQKKFNNRKKYHRELIILAIIINADKSAYFKDKVFMTHHDKFSREWNIEFPIYKKEIKSPLQVRQLWTPRVLSKDITDEYQFKKQVSLELINSHVQPWLNILKVLFEDTEKLQHHLDNSIQLLKQHEKEVKEEPNKCFIFTLKPSGVCPHMSFTRSKRN